MSTKLLAKKLIEQEFWKEPNFSLQDLFRIRDCLVILQQYGVGDLDLIREVSRYIDEKAKNEY